MAWRVVIDTNIVVSAALTRRGAPVAVLDSIADRRAVLCVSQPILDEYEAVLLRPRLRLDPERVGWLLDMAKAEGLIVAPSRSLKESPDEADNRFLECAEAAAADYLVTGNIKDFPREFKTTEIVTAREFVALLKARR